MSGIYRTVRKIWLIAAMMLIPGCLDSTPESIDGVDISVLAESFVEGDSIQFMASGNNPKGAKFLWDFGDSTGSSGKNVKHTYTEEGTYTVTLTVIDESSRIGVAKKEVDILYRNQAPVASLEATYGGVGQQVKVNSIAFFDGGASSDPDGDVLEFEWDFGDGGKSTLLRPNHEYTSTGNYTVTLKVTDPSNESSTAETWVLVNIRTYNVEFVQNEITIPAFAGYTAEGATTTQNHNYPYNLTSVTYDLEWEEDEELDSPDNPVVGTLFPDDFSLGVSTNYVFNLSDNGTSGNLEIEFDVLSSIPDNLVLSLGSESEVRQYLFQNGYTSAKGQGTWITSITCNDAPSIVPELFNEVDQGNDWILYVTYTFYESIITEV
jgi:PKD repeat protein|tara:strand:+ start:42 stop:1175 length:1134 start_codon:yes stop_codon:yes gene_type:complete